MMMSSIRGRRGRGELLHEMGFSLVGCIRNLTLNVEFENGKGAETVISVQRKNVTEYDASAFDDAELTERVEPDGQRSDQTVRLVDEGKGEGKKGEADVAVAIEEGQNLGRRTLESGDGVSNTCSVNRTYKRMVARGSTENGSLYEFARATERASINTSCYAAGEQNIKPISMERSHSIEIQYDHVPVVKETYYPVVEKHCPSGEKSEHMAYVAKEYPLGKPNPKDNQYSWQPDNGNKERDFLLEKPNREEKEFPKQPDYGMKEQHFNRSSEFVRETTHNKTDFSQKILSREFDPANQMSGDFKSRPASRGCFSCGNEGHMARDCPSKKTEACRICKQEGHVSRDCTAKKPPMQCHKCGEEGHMSRDCTAKKPPMQCHNCGQEGHISRDCTAKKPPMLCHNCGQDGHISRDCTASKPCRNCGQDGHTSRDCTANRSCRNCGQEGHMSRECTANKPCRNCGQEGHVSRDCTANKTCRNCGQEGHMFRECPAAKPSIACYNCGQEGHIARDCPSEKAPMECRRCGQAGHMARDCPTSEGAKDDKADRPPPYIPPPPPDDDEHIFETLLKGINFNKYDEIPVECTGRNAPANGRNSFFDFELSDVLQSNIVKSKYDKPTPIQKWAIPVILNGRDVMACAVTGSGKTAAFLLPILTKIIRNETVASCDGVAIPEAVILSPTRELAVQIYHEVRKFAHDTMVNSAVIYGGVSTMYLFTQLNKGAHIVVATPGRLLDLTRKGKISMSRVKHLVLDEADRMLDLGFLPDIRSIINEHGMPVRTSRQTLMFSATFPDEMQLLASEMLNDYIFITVGCVGGASEDIEQIVHNVRQSEKRQKLFEILQAENARVVVFVELKRNADFLSNQLTQSQFPTASIHSDLSQKDREAGLNDFRTGRATVLVATSVAARGLDIPEVKHVINFDMPSSIEEYVHRIGRTGRCGNLGKATSFFDPDRDSSLTRALVKILVDAKQVIPDWLEDMAVHSVGTGGFTGRSDGRFGARDNRRQFGRGRPRIGEGDTAMCENVVSRKQQEASFHQQEETWDD